jgi:hypothetical protein
MGFEPVDRYALEVASNLHHKKLTAQLNHLIRAHIGGGKRRTDASTLHINKPVFLQPRIQGLCCDLSLGARTADRGRVCRGQLYLERQQGGLCTGYEFAW